MSLLLTRCPPSAGSPRTESAGLRIQSLCFFLGDPIRSGGNPPLNKQNLLGSSPLKSRFGVCELTVIVRTGGLAKVVPMVFIMYYQRTKNYAPNGVMLETLYLCGCSCQPSSQAARAASRGSRGGQAAEAARQPR